MWGPEHPDLATLMIHLCAAYMDVPKGVEHAIPLQQRIIHIFKANYGENFPGRPYHASSASGAVIIM